LTNYAGYWAYFILTSPLRVVLADEDFSKYRDDLRFEEISCFLSKIVKMWEHFFFKCDIPLVFYEFNMYNWQSKHN